MQPDKLTASAHSLQFQLASSNCKCNRFFYMILLEVFGAGSVWLWLGRFGCFLSRSVLAGSLAPCVCSVPVFRFSLTQFLRFMLLSSFC
jgi:hypothetical protein